MIVEFSNEAENDLEQIADYIARENPRRALSFVRELRNRCANIADSPNGFALVPRYESYGIRRYVHGNYLFFYRIENAKVVIIRVLHGAADYGAILFAD